MGIIDDGICGAGFAKARVLKGVFAVTSEVRSNPVNHMAKTPLNAWGYEADGRA